MDLSAARPVQQRYTAGGCILEVTLQPSALSQWYPRPVAQVLAFKLWLDASPASEENRQLPPTLVAQGDRETFQAIAHYIAQQTRNALTVAHFSDAPTRTLAPCPPSFHVQPPLSYLQLCDLTAVFDQVEQATPLLPVSLTSSKAASKPSGRLIPFLANHKLWASSAAAALLAVGLTTALWPRSAEDAAVISDASPLDLAAPTAELEPPQNAAPSSEEAPTPESAPVSPESAAVDPLGAIPTAPPDIRPAPPAQTSPPPTAAAGELQRETQEETDARLPPLPTQSTARQSAARASNENYQVSPSATADVQTDESNTIAQVQRYFQAQWQASAQDVQLPLAYELQLSKSGEVISFAGLSNTAQAYGDRLLSPTPLTFSNSADEPLTLRLMITVDGIVQVSEP